MSGALGFFARLLVPFGLLGEATDFTNVQYDNGHGTTLHAYLAKPPNFDATVTYPAAIVLHAWNGMSEEPVYFADLLAEQGFIVLAPDMFRNVATCEINIPWNILTTLCTPQDRIDEDIDAAISYLTSEAVGNVDSTRIFSGPGFCFGGSQSLILSSRRAMFGTVSLYGANIDMFQNAVGDSVWGEIGSFGSQVLGIYGQDDDNPSPAEAEGFQSAMNTRNITNTVTIYDGVGHGFVNPEDHRNSAPQATQAWDQAVAFMNGIVASGLNVPLSRRTMDRHSHAHAEVETRTRGSWLWDHTMDVFQSKGHFSHGLRHKLASHSGHLHHSRVARQEESTESTEAIETKVHA